MTLLKEIIDEVNLKKIIERMEEGKCSSVIKDSPQPKQGTNSQPNNQSGNRSNSYDDIPPEFDSVKSLNQLLIDTAK